MKKSAPKDVSKEDFGKVFDYVTRFGRFIRRTSIDELPQLFNILFGSMSFVGPRPIIWNNSAWIEERDKYNAHSIRPGITGLAQINGRDSISYEEKSKLDGIYCKKISFTLDLKIIFKTIRVVITKNGVIEDKQG